MTERQTNRPMLAELLQAFVSERIFPASYERQKLVWCHTDHGLKDYIACTGVAQGSILGPLLWNIMYNDIPAIQEEATIVSFADNIALDVIINYLEEVELHSCNAIRPLRLS